MKNFKKLLLIALISIVSALICATMITAYAETKNYSLTLSQIGNGDVTVKVNNVEQFDTTLTVKEGDTVELTTASTNFLFYLDGNNKVITTEKTCTAKITGDMEIKPIFKNTNTNKVMVIYQNDVLSDQVLSIATYNLATIDQIFTKHLVEKANIFGYSFSSWSSTVAEIIASAKSGTKTVIVKPQYVANEESFKVEVSGGYIVDASVSSMYEVNSRIQIVANEAESGKKFAYWIDGLGAVVSTSKSISVPVSSDQLYTAVFIKESDGFDNVPVVNVSGTYDPSIKMYSLLSHRYLPTDCTLISYGLIYSKENLYEDDKLNLGCVDGTSIKASETFNAKYKNGYWSNSILFNQCVSIRAYIKYLDNKGDLCVAYSSVIQFKPIDSTIGQENFNGDYKTNSEITVNGTVSKTSIDRLSVTKGSINANLDFSKASFISTEFNIYFNDGSFKNDFVIAMLKANYSGDSSSVGDGLILDWDDPDEGIENARLPILKVDTYGFVYLCNSSGSWVKTSTKVHLQKFYKFRLDVSTVNKTCAFYINNVYIDTVSFKDTRKLELSILDASTTSNVQIDNIVIKQTLNIANECASHTYIDTVVSPTCKTNGYTKQICKYCGAQRVINYTTAISHSFVEGRDDSVNHNIIYYCEMCDATNTVAYTTLPYTIVYDKTDNTSYDRAKELAETLSEVYKCQLPLCELSNIDTLTKYIDTTGYTFVSADYGWTVNGDTIKIFAGALVGRDLAIESFANYIKDLDDYNTAVSKSYSVQASSTMTNAKKYDQQNYDDMVIDSIINSKENYQKNTDVSEITGTIYYVSNNGNDSNDGKSSSNAIKTLSKINSLIDGGTVKSGDAILFERGSLFRPTTVSGSILHSISGIVIGCYGDTSKDRPIITSSKYNYAVGDMWEEVAGEENIWATKTATAKNVGSIRFIDKDGKITYGEKKRSIQVDSGEIYSGSAYLTSDFAFFNGVFGNDTLKSFNIYSNFKIYVYYEGDLNNDFVDIEISEGYSSATKNEIADTQKYPAIDLNGKSNVIIDGITFQDVGFEAVKISQYSSTELYSENISIQNCMFDTCANSIQKYNTSDKGNIYQKDYVIEVYSSVVNLTIKDNFFINMLNGAILITSSSKDTTNTTAKIDVDVCGNVIERMYIGVDVYSYLNLETCEINIYDNMFSKENDLPMADEGRVIVEGNNCPASIIARGMIGDDMIYVSNNIFDKAYIHGVSGTVSQGLIFRTTPINNNADIAGQASKSTISPYMSSIDHITFSNNTIIQYEDQLILRNRVISPKSYKGDYSATNTSTFEQFPYVNGDFIVCIVERDSADFDYDYDKDASIGRAAYTAPAVQETATIKKVILCIGQSNMGGRGYLTNKTSPCVGTYNAAIAVDPITDDRIFTIDKSTGYTSYKTMTEPIFVNDKGECGASLVTTFALAYVETFDENLGILPGAKGGTGISQWMPGTALYNNAVSMVRAAQSMGAEIIAILWHQGETDSSNKSYANNLEIMLDALYHDIGTTIEKCPLLIGELAQTRNDASSADSDIKTKYSFSTGATPFLNSTEFPKFLTKYAYGKVGIVSSYGLRNCGEGIHFDGASLRVFGYRYFNKYCEVMGYTDKYYTFNDTINCKTWQECDAVLDTYIAINN